MNNKKFVFIDLDGTLIETASGQPLPKGVWDMRLKLDVFQKLKKLRPTALFIVTNQGGIEKGLVNLRFFQRKAAYVLAALQEYLGVECMVDGRVCASNNPNNPDRKPNTGMLEGLCGEWARLRGEAPKKEEIVMIGDASGREGDFSDSDLRTAERFGCDYCDVRDFLRAQVRDGEIQLR